jgi:UDP-N-acetylmuramoylalanine-D-glutamate ligase
MEAGFCVECEDTVAKVSCVECGDNYCDLCFDSQHRKGARAKHTKEPCGDSAVTKRAADSGDVYYGCALPPNFVRRKRAKTVDDAAAAAAVLPEAGVDEQQLAALAKTASCAPLRLSTADRDKLLVCLN